MPPVNRPRTHANQRPQRQPKKLTSKNSSLVIIIVLVIIALIAIVFFFGYPLINKSEAAHPVIIDTTESTPVDTTETIIPIIEEPQIIVKQESSSSVPKGYYIIVGSFRDKNNADNMAKNIRKDIELTIYFFEEIGMYRVSAGQYDNIHKAYNDTYSVKDLDGCANAWVLENQ